MFDRIVQFALLNDFYGQLLTPKQIEIMDMHYSDDLSLSEISEHLNISRQGVHDSLKRAEHALIEYEEKLGLVKRFLEQKDKIERVISMLDNILESDEDLKQTKNRVKEIREFISDFL